MITDWRFKSVDEAFEFLKSREKLSVLTVRLKNLYNTGKNVGGE